MKKQIIIKEIRLINFKGLRNQTIVFDNTTNIFGDNGTGKSTIFDGFTWLLFGKDSTDRKDFEVKTLDANNNVIPKIEHEVTAVILVNDEEVELKRILKEKWVKARGAATAEFSGNETLYYWNEVPMQLKEYQAKIDGILDENIFKLITNPLAFNSLKWQDRRSVLIQMCGEVSDTELAGENPEYQELVKSLSNKTLDEYRKEVSAKRKKLNADLKSIPTRIDEVSRNTPNAMDFAGIRKEIAEKQKEIAALENQIEDKSTIPDSVAAAIKQYQNEVHELSFSLGNIEFDAKVEAKNSIKSGLTIDVSERNALKATLDNKSATLKEYKDTLIELEGKKEALQVTLQQLRDRWKDENSREFVMKENDCKCPTCERAFEAADLEAKKAKMFENFQKDKAAKLSAIDTEGITRKNEDAKLELRISKGTEVITKLQPEVLDLETKLAFENNRIESLQNPTQVIDEKSATEEALNKILKGNKEYEDLVNKLAKLEANPVTAPKVDVQDLKDQKDALNLVIDQLKKDLSIEESINAANKRVEELEKEESNLSQQIMEIEGREFNIEAFIKFKIETLEKKINAKFRFVNFKLFDTQINGGVVEVCEALVNGVPFSNANTASKINSGLDIINTLCDFYGVTAPIFIDNRESVVELIDSDSQIINLIVSKPDKSLRVEACKAETVEV